MPPLLTLLLLLQAGSASAFSARLVDEAGAPIAGAQISVVGQVGVARSDEEGRFTLHPEPIWPATLIVMVPGSEILSTVHLTEPLAREVRIDRAHREEMTVREGVAPNIEAPPAAAEAIITTEELRERRPHHIAEVVAEGIGVALRGEGAPAVPVIRGMAGGRTLLIIDDARILSERRAGASASLIPPFSLASIEIARGPGSSRYGSDAIGGVIHLRSRDPIPAAPEHRFEAWTELGGRSARGAAVELGTDAFGGAVLATILARSAASSRDAAGDEISDSEYQDASASLRFVREFAEGRLRAGFLTTRATDVGVPSIDPVSTAYPSERASLFTLGLDLETPFLFSLTEVRAALGSHTLTTERIRSDAVESSTTSARDASFRLSGERGTRHSRFLAGIDFVSRHDLRASHAIADADRHDLGLFGSWERRVSGPLTLHAAARADSFRQRNREGFFGNRSRNDTAWSGSLAASAAPLRRATITLQIASAYREPTLSDRYYRGITGRGFITGNPDLQPERSLQIDAAMRWSAPRASVAFYAYDYRIRDLIERYGQGPDFFFRNRGEAIVRGVEWEMTGQLGRGLLANVGGGVARGEDAASGDPLDDISEPTLRASVRWASARLSAYAALAAHGDDDRPGPVEVARQGYRRVDAGAGWRFTPSLSLRVVVRNLTNEQHFASAGAAAPPAPGRSIAVSIHR